MRCPYCKADNDRVIDSRASGDGFAIRRRRVCLECSRRYTTYERVESAPLRVVKKNGERLAFSTPEALWVLDLKSNSKRRIAPEHAGGTSPAWSPDSRQLAFESDVRGILDIWVVDVDGGNTTRLTGGSSEERSPAWSPNGRKIAFA